MKYVYLLRNGEDYYKVGVAVNVANRLRTIQTSNPERVTLVCSRLVRNAEEVETRIHTELVERKSGGGSEWFMLSPEDALEVAALINLEPQPRVLDRQLTVETLLAEMREERVEMHASLKNLIKMVADIKLKSIPTPAVSAMPDKAEFDSPPIVEPENEVIKPTLEQYENMAIKIFGEIGSASSSLLQRRLGIGYAKAARIVDNLEEKGYIGPASGGPKARAFIRKNHTPSVS